MPNLKPCCSTEHFCTVTARNASTVVACVTTRSSHQPILRQHHKQTQVGHSERPVALRAGTAFTEHITFPNKHESYIAHTCFTVSCVSKLVQIKLALCQLDPVERPSSTAANSTLCWVLVLYTLQSFDHKSVQF